MFNKLFETQSSCVLFQQKGQIELSIVLYHPYYHSYHLFFWLILTPQGKLPRINAPVFIDPYHQFLILQDSNHILFKPEVPVLLPELVHNDSQIFDHPQHFHC